MARAKKDIEKEIIEVVKKLPVEKKAQVLDFAKGLSKPAGAGVEPKGKKGEGALFWEQFIKEGLYEGDGSHYDHDRIYEDML